MALALPSSLQRAAGDDAGHAEDRGNAMKRIYVVGTADTKGEELAFLADVIATTGAAVTRVDYLPQPRLSAGGSRATA